MNRGVVLFFGFLLTLFVLFNLWPSVSEQRFRRNAKRFNALYVNGKIDTLFYDRGRITFFLRNDTTVYAFAASNKSLDDKDHPFETSVNSGDSIIKPPFSDTIKVMKKSKILTYSLNK